MAFAASASSRRGLTALALAAVCVLSSKTATAQLHGDAAVQIGAMKRFLSEKAGDDAGFGPTAQLSGHVALLPLVHVGGYFGHDISPLPSPASARNITFGGIRAKGMIPFVRGEARAWIFVGFGFAGVYQQSYRATVNVPDGLGGSDRKEGRVEGAGGRFFEVPFGIGASYKLRKPWELCAELGARVGLGHTGSIYEQGAQLSIFNGPGQNATPAGLDRFALGLTVGVMIDL